MKIHSGVNILLVEDDSLLRNTIASMIEFHGHAVFHAYDEIQVTDLVKSTRYDILIYSFNPVKILLSEAVLNAKNFQPSLKIIIANDYEDDEIFPVNLGVDGYIKKPFTLNELQDVISKVMRVDAGTASSA